jgi:hypothetical protein
MASLRISLKEIPGHLLCAAHDIAGTDLKDVETAL